MFSKIGIIITWQNLKEGREIASIHEVERKKGGHRGTKTGTYIPPEHWKHHPVTSAF